MKKGNINKGEGRREKRKGGEKNNQFAREKRRGRRGEEKKKYSRRENVRFAGFKARTMFTWLKAIVLSRGFFSRGGGEKSFHSSLFALRNRI